MSLASDGFQPSSSLSMRPDGTVLYLARGANDGSLKSNRLVLRPAGGVSAFAAAFPAAFGASTSSLTILSLSPPTPAAPSW